MSTPILMPSVDPATRGGRLIRWLRHEGDFVEAGEPLAEIAADHATMDVEAPHSGVLVRILAEAGGPEIAVESVLGLIETGPAPHLRPRARDARTCRQIMPHPDFAACKTAGARGRFRSCGPRRQRTQWPHCRKRRTCGAGRAGGCPSRGNPAAHGERANFFPCGSAPRRRRFISKPIVASTRCKRCAKSSMMSRGRKKRRGSRWSIARSRLLRWPSGVSRAQMSSMPGRVTFRLGAQCRSRPDLGWRAQFSAGSDYGGDRFAGGDRSGAREISGAADCRRSDLCGGSVWSPISGRSASSAPIRCLSSHGQACWHWERRRSAWWSKMAFPTWRS